MENFLSKTDFMNLMGTHDLTNKEEHPIFVRIVHCLSILESNNSAPARRADLAEYLNVPITELTRFRVKTNSFRLLPQNFFIVLLTDASTLLSVPKLPVSCFKPLSREVIESIFPNIMIFKYFAKLASLERYLEKTEQHKLHDQGLYQLSNRRARVRKTMLPQIDDLIDFSDVVAAS